MDEHPLDQHHKMGGKKKTKKIKSSWESLGFKRLCGLYVSNNNNLLHTFYALVIVQVNSERIQSRLTPSAAASVAIWSCFLTSGDRCKLLIKQKMQPETWVEGGATQCLLWPIYIGLVVSRTLLTIVGWAEANSL
jgi:hypothetical protein